MSKIAADKAIGVFDSGMGGLTVLRQLKAALPDESYVYVGDTARLPYGTKSVSSIVQYALDIAGTLVAASIKMLVIACNTATMAALPTLQQHYPQIPIIGVIQPGAQALAEASPGGNALILATETTVASGCYATAIARLDPSIRVSQGACGLWVALSEEGFIDHSLSQLSVSTYLQRFHRDEHDVVLLGCTHFPVFKPLLVEMLPQGVAIVDSAIETAKVVKQTLHRLGWLNHDTSVDKGKVCYWVTDSPQRFSRIGPYFLGEPIHTHEVTLLGAREGALSG